jgi:hypothetical protein
MCTVCLNIETHRVLSTQLIGVLHIILIMDSDCETTFLEAVQVLCMILPIKAVISLHTINSLVFILDKESVQFEAGTSCLCKIRVNFLFPST